MRGAAYSMTCRDALIDKESWTRCPQRKGQPGSFGSLPAGAGPDRRDMEEGKTEKKKKGIC